MAAPGAPTLFCRPVGHFADVRSRSLSYTARMRFAAMAAILCLSSPACTSAGDRSAAGSSTSGSGGAGGFGGALPGSGGTNGGAAGSGNFSSNLHAQGGGTAVGGSPSAGGASADSGGNAGSDGNAGSAGQIADGGLDTPPPAPIPPPAPVGCVTDVTPGVHELPCDTTTHVVMVPDECVAHACGVIVDVHGGSMSADMEDKNTNMRALGEQYGYIVIQPNALPNPLLLGERTFIAGDDDVRVMNILTDVMEAFHADRKRIHMMGFSEGGFMTWRWICAHSDLLASAAPAAAGWNCTVLTVTQEIGCQFSGTDAPDRNIPILYMQGKSDQLMNPQCVFSWLKSNVYPTLKLDSGRKIAGDATYERTRSLDPDAVPFELITHSYSTDAQFFGVAVGGHCYPGSTDFTATLPGQLMGFGCKDDCSFTWSEEAVRFFVAHPKR